MEIVLEQLLPTKLKFLLILFRIKYLHSPQLIIRRLLLTHLLHKKEREDAYLLLDA
jgi:hypothetical protein